MPTPTKGPRLGSGPAHERLMMANLATSLFEHGRITTTHTKAKRLRPYAERLVTYAKRGDLAARRHVLTVIHDKSVVHTLFTEIGPRYSGRPGGYTRITKIGPRKGDNAPMAVIELVEPMTVAQEAVGEAEAATRRTAKDRSTSAGEVPPEGGATEQRTVATAGAPDTGESTDVDEATEAEESAEAEDTVAAVETADAGEDETGEPKGES